MAYEDGSNSESFADRQERLNPAPQMSPTASRLNKYFQQSMGRDGTAQELGAWGNDIDAQYEGKIAAAIGNSTEAKAYAANQANPRTETVAPPAPPVPGSPVTATGKIEPAAPAAAAPAPAAPVAQSAPQPQAVAGNRNIDTSNVPAMPTYTAAQVGGPQLPDQSGLNTQQNTLMSSVMANPEVLNLQTIAQMKEAQKQQALLMAQQAKGQYAQGAVGRGTLNSGRTDAFGMTTDANLQNAVLNSNRDIDINAAQTNRANQLAALGASSALGQDQLGRALSADNAGMAHAGFNADQNFKAYGSQADASKDMYARALAAAQNSQQNYGQDLQAEFGRGAMNLQRDQFAQGGSQWLQQFLENQRQFNTNTGLNYDQLNSNNYNAGMNRLVPR